MFYREFSKIRFNQFLFILKDINTLNLSVNMSIDIPKTAAYNLYLNGNDLRSQKNGKPLKLLENYDRTSTIRTIGVFKYYLSNEDRRIIVSNDRADIAKRNEWSFIQKIAKIVLKVHQDMDTYKTEKDVKACVKIPSTHLYNMLLAIASGKEDQINLYKEKEIKLMLDSRKIFMGQERSKVMAK